VLVDQPIELTRAAQIRPETRRHAGSFADDNPPRPSCVVMVP
jgi:hypothetical protein